MSEDYFNANPENQENPQAQAQEEISAPENLKKPVRGTKTPASVKANALANQMVKKRYAFPQIKIGDNDVYYIEANSMSFDRILRRSPREVNKNADIYDIPLGLTCSSAIISAYGLSNSEIYKNVQWLRLIKNYNDDKNDENTTKVVNFLHAAACLKYFRVSGQMVNTSDPYEFIGMILDVNEVDLVNYFAEMVR